MLEEKEYKQVEGGSWNRKTVLVQEIKIVLNSNTQESIILNHIQAYAINCSKANYSKLITEVK